ncbi:MAG: hypothetical protein Q4P66_08825 [Actinomycetaceae bacterium]|nr:hypothetical protein [Actinomycetaceae bacterium]
MTGNNKSTGQAVKTAVTVAQIATTIATSPIGLPHDSTKQMGDYQRSTLPNYSLQTRATRSTTTTSGKK